MEIVFVILMLVVVYVAVPKGQRREDPLHRGPAVGSKQHGGPAINRAVDDPDWAHAYVGRIATGGGEPLTDEDVRRLYTEIVMNGELNQKAKYYMLDGLYQRTMNDHPRGMGADVLEEISNESIALDHPNWHGRHGNWHSVNER